MTQPTGAVGQERDSATPPAPVDVDSATLMNGRRELLIRHGAHTYRLRITASNKLILTK
jgi:hemin uptake protein HemP